MQQALASSTPIGVIGAGAMGRGIAQVAALAGHPVILFDANPTASEKAMTQILAALHMQVEKGTLPPEVPVTVAARLRPATEWAQLSVAGLVIETNVEDLTVKQGVLRELEPLLGAEVILATHTSSLSVTALGAALQHPERLVGMHFFNPAPVMPLVEIISGLATAPACAQQVYATAQAWGKVPVYAKSTPGFIVNRIAQALCAESLRVLQEGASDVATLDALLREAGGFRMGAFEWMDLIGHDVWFAVVQSLFTAHFHDSRFLPSLVQQELVLAGRLGRKTGQGFYDYRATAVKPMPQTALSTVPIESVHFQGHWDGLLAPLVTLAQQAGLQVSCDAGEDNSHYGCFTLDGCVTLALSDGRSATERCAEEGLSELVVFDLADDYATASRIGIARATQASAAAQEKAVAFWQALGKSVSVLADIPGLVVLRTVCMLANEGADTVNHGVAHVMDVDRAMCEGLYYPRGPLQWADALGLDFVLYVLGNLQESYGEARYRTSPLLRRLAYAGADFYPSV